VEPVRKLDESGIDYEYAVSMSAGRPLANYPPGLLPLGPDEAGGQRVGTVDPVVRMANPSLKP
jgi:hypothetical protein